jgi:HK97 gp10 family phage protein
MAGKFAITGVKEFDKKLKKLGSEGLKMVRRAMREVQKEMAGDIKNAVPVGETKETKKGVKVKAGRRSRKQISMNVVIGSKDPADFHAAFVEFGTEDIPANPAARQTFDKNKNSARDSLEEKIGDGIRKLTKGK